MVTYFDWDRGMDVDGTLPNISYRQQPLPPLHPVAHIRCGSPGNDPWQAESQRS